MARTSKETKRAARAAAMQLLYEAFAGGDGGEDSVQLAYELLREVGVVTPAMDEAFGSKVPVQETQEAPSENTDAAERQQDEKASPQPIQIKRALPNTPDRAFIAEMVAGVVAEAADLDQHIEKASIGWPVHRIPRVDLVILRMGAWELIHRPQLSPAIVVNEAVHLANQFSEPTSGRFINGVLGTIGRTLARPGEKADG